MNKLIKILACLILFLMFQTSISAQTSNQISVNMINSQLKQVLDSLEVKTGFFFAYNVESVNLDRIVSISMNNKKVDEVLNSLFKDTNIQYAIQGKNILLSPIQEKQTPLLKEISGRITDSNGEPVIGASIVVVETKTGTATDIDGRYTLKARTGDRLQISYIGMQTYVVRVDNRNVINVILTESEHIFNPNSAIEKKSLFL